MKCYLVTEDYPTLREDEPEPHTRFLRICDGDAGVGVYIADRFLMAGGQLVEDFEKYAEGKDLHLPYARIADRGPFRLVSMKREARQSDPLALVHIAIPAPPGGKVFLRANTYTEKLVEHPRMGPRIERDYHDLSNNPGVELVRNTDLSESTGHFGYHGVEGNVCHWLVKMYPGSSLRVHREPAEHTDVPVLVVAWPGGRLRVFRPASSKRHYSSYRRKKPAGRRRYRNDRAQA